MRISRPPSVSCYVYSGAENTTEPVTLDRLCNVDMMRGEETEAIGLWTALRPNHDLMLVLPGSHNKFISVGRDGSLRGCMTSISGELLDVLTHHTVLSESLESAFVSPQDYDSSLMLAGAAACDAGLGRAAFSCSHHAYAGQLHRIRGT